MIARALAAGLRLDTVLTDPAAADRLAHLVPDDVQVLVAPRTIIATISGLGVHRGALALVGRPPTRQPLELLAAARTVVILEGVTNPVNVGLIARSALAFGVDALLVDEQTADPLYRRAVSASRGATMHLPWARADTSVGLIGQAHDTGFDTLALTLADDAEALPTAAASLGERRAVVLGNEGAGLTAITQRACTYRATIEMDAGPGVDSLNVAAAAAIAFHELRRSGRHDLH